MGVDPLNKSPLYSTESTAFSNGGAFPSFAKTSNSGSAGKQLLDTRIGKMKGGIQIHRIWENNDPLLGLSINEKIRGVANRILHSDFYKKWYLFLTLLSTLCLVLTFMYTWYVIAF